MSLIATPCQIVRRSDTGDVDELGDPVSSESVSSTVCDLQQKRRDEPLVEGEWSVTIWDCFLPIGTGIDTGDAVVVGDAEYEVVGAPWQAGQGSAAVNHVAATLRKTGSLEGVVIPYADRFWSKIDQTGECWLWRASLDTAGYGQFGLCGRLVLAHRLAYELLVGPIPPGLQVHHRCEARACCNPDHLELVTAREHKALHGPSGLFAENAAKTHCVRGHPLAGSNLYEHEGRRRCRACRAEAQRRYLEKR